MLEDHFGSGSTLQRNERVKLAASFWNNIGVGMVIGGTAAFAIGNYRPNVLANMRGSMIAPWAPGQPKNSDR
jgi:hypothetical protein